MAKEFDWNDISMHYHTIGKAHELPVLFDKLETEGSVYFEWKNGQILRASMWEGERLQAIMDFLDGKPAELDEEQLDLAEQFTKALYGMSALDFIRRNEEKRRATVERRANFDHRAIKRSDDIEQMNFVRKPDIEEMEILQPKELKITSLRVSA